MNTNINNATSKSNSKTTVFSYLKKPINAYLLMGLVAVFLTLTANLTFFGKLISIYHLSSNFGFVLSVGVVLLGLHLLLITLMGYKYTLKAVLIFFIMAASAAGYFTDVYGTVYDTNMLQNALQTDKAEAGDLMNIKFLSRILLLGILPSLLIVILNIRFPTFKKTGLMDKKDAVIRSKAIEYIALQGMKVLNQKSALFVSQKTPKRMVIKEENKTTNVKIVIVNLLVVSVLIMLFFGKNTHLVNKHTLSWH